MLNNTAKILKKCEPLSKLSVKHILTTTAMQNERIQSFRVKENNPCKHGLENVGQYYRIPQEDKNQIFMHGGLPKSFEIQSKTFNETCLMLRKPSLDVINILKNSDYSKPVVRFVLYGKRGNGKSLSLAHILHYAFKEGFLLVHVPWVGDWMRRCKESSNSESKEGYIDLNLNAAAWLVHFKTQNAHLFSNLTFKTTREYVWSKREKTPKDSSISDLIEYGISRVKYASSVAVSLCDEIKELSKRGVCKTLIAIDGYNALFYPKTRVYTEKKEVVHPHKVTLTEGFLNLTKVDWHNGAVIIIVDELAIAEEDQISHLPRYLLGINGFDHLDPFVPIRIPGYDKKELLSCMEYYRERKWIQPYPGQDEEVEFVSAMNPYRIMKICAGF